MSLFRGPFKSTLLQVDGTGRATDWKLVSHTDSGGWDVHRCLGLVPVCRPPSFPVSFRGTHGKAFSGVFHRALVACMKTLLHDILISKVPASPWRNTSSGQVCTILGPVLCPRLPRMAWSPSELCLPVQMGQGPLPLLLLVSGTPVTGSCEEEVPAGLP